MMSKMFKVLLLVAIAANLMLVGCTKKPKIDVSGLRNAPAGSGNGAGLGEDGEFNAIDGDSIFDPMSGDGMNGLNGSNGLNGAGEGAGKDGSWVGTDASLAGGLGGNFLSNAQKWNEIVYFAYDRSEIAASERPKLDSLAQVLASNPKQAVIIEGHCDDRGSDEYNRALSERRALAVKDYLATLGVEDARMQTISYGEDKPAVANAQSEQEHAQNRRAEFLVGDLK